MQGRLRQWLCDYGVEPTSRLDARETDALADAYPVRRVDEPRGGLAVRSEVTSSPLSDVEYLKRIRIRLPPRCILLGTLPAWFEGSAIRPQIMQISEI